eukprot:TRINITY_DN12382_c0_g1_i1.p1 TRINITY_DN12382_c0_g1~~TRINITY_DN12382_c0_g1_i1.p1  ORF type:complete len:182 (-),score=28.98 TRINITY_DN12382_c0_g1_i1:84-629(-)
MMVPSRIPTPNEGVMNLSDALVTNPSLTSLQLHFPTVKYNDQALARMPGLSPRIALLDLDFTDSNMTDLGLGFITEGLQRLTTLTTLKLFISTTKITDVSVSRLCTVLSALPKLSLLHLELQGCRSVGERSIDKIVGLIKSKKTLLHVTLNVKGTQMTSKAKDSLSQLKSLKNSANIKVTV